MALWGRMGFRKLHDLLPVYGSPLSLPTLWEWGNIFIILAKKNILLSDTLILHRFRKCSSVSIVPCRVVCVFLRCHFVLRFCSFCPVISHLVICLGLISGASSWGRRGRAVMIIWVVDGCFRTSWQTWTPLWVQLLAAQGFVRKWERAFFVSALCSYASWVSEYIIKMKNY